jgi:NAD(P)-dependent dehydrogenase (short-subunit alcohol dehydrogenase family)
MDSPQLSPSAPVVLVTGAAKRLGREIALVLAGAGWLVAVHHRSSPDQAAQTLADCRSLGEPKRSHCIFQADLSDEAACRALVPRVLAQCGRLDAVVNNASTFEPDNAASFSFAAMEKHWRSNTGAPILLAQALHEHVRSRRKETAVQGAQEQEHGSAVVVNLLDQKLWNQNPDFFSYTLSKAALEAANTVLAMALAPLVRVVGVAPGLSLPSPYMSQERFAQLHQLSPLGRSSSPQDVAAAVRFALENRSLTGTTLLVDGGQHLMKFERDFSLMP